MGLELGGEGAVSEDHPGERNHRHGEAEEKGAARHLRLLS